MKKMYLVLIILFNCNKMNAQNSIRKDILNIIAKDEYLFKNPKIFDTNRIILIDTFGFFTADISNKYDGVYIDVHERKPELKKVKNVFYVMNISTVENNALRIIVWHRWTNYATEFYFKINGNEIILLKRKGGTF